MTIDLNTVPPVAGESAMNIRGILRRSHGAFREDWLSDRLRCDERRAHEFAKALEAAGYVRRDREREEKYRSPFLWYSVTDAGQDLTRASAAKRIRRETAKTAFSEFMNRVHFVNASPKYFYSVRYVALFGSYLERRERLGDIDVAIDLKPRIAFDKAGEWVETFRQHAWDSGRSFSTWDEEIDWPRREVVLMHKSRKRSMSIQSWFSFVEMAKSKNFRYEVLLGGEDEIRHELAKARREQKRASKS